MTEKQEIKGLIRKIRAEHPNEKLTNFDIMLYIVGELERSGIDAKDIEAQNKFLHELNEKALLIYGDDTDGQEK